MIFDAEFYFLLIANKDSSKQSLQISQDHKNGLGLKNDLPIGKRILLGLS